MTFIQKQALWVSRDANGNINLHFPTTHVAYVEGGVATVNGATPDENKNVTITDITGNSATATKLKSAISINNVAFDGTKNINIPVGVKTVNGIEPSADGDVVVAGVPIGFEYISFNPNIPTGSLPLLGGTFSRTAYKDLWEWVQTQTNYLISESAWQAKATANEGNVPFYSTGDGSTTFRVPSLSCWVKGAKGISEVGSYLAAGLPNITGSAQSTGGNDTASFENTTGAYTSEEGSFKPHGSSTNTKYDGLSHMFTFNASLSNPIYGNSDTVQPPSIVGMWLVKAFGTVSNIGNQDIADVSAGLARVETKMNEYTDNVTYIDSFIVESWRSGTEWYRKYSDGTIEQGGYVSTTTATYPLPFANTDYTLLTGSNRGGSNNSGNFYYVTAWTTTGFTHALDSNQKVWWYAVGQGAT